jgi:hypothetical protein
LGRAGEARPLVSDPLPPRIPREIEQAVERVDGELDANQREYDELAERRHFLASEHERLRRKLLLLDGGY